MLKNQNQKGTKERDTHPTLDNITLQSTRNGIPHGMPILETISGILHTSSPVAKKSKRRERTNKPGKKEVHFNNKWVDLFQVFVSEERS
jgi:hypothetical protein